MAQLTQSTAYARMFLLIDPADHFSGLAGATGISVTISKNGGAFAAAGGSVSEVSGGWYKISLTTTDTNTLGDLAFHVTATNADPTDFVDQVVTGTVTLATGQITIKKNAALSKFTFPLFDATTHQLVSGKTVTAQRSLDGGAFANCSNSVVEVGSGFYYVDLAAGDLNANVVALKFTATGCDDQAFVIITQP